MKLTDVVKIPVVDMRLQPLDARIQDACDVRWAAGYALAASSVVAPHDSPAYFVLIFQPRLDAQSYPVCVTNFNATSPPGTAPSPA